MAIQQITIGTPGAGGGDPAHAAFKKVNDNFTNTTNAASRQVGVAYGNVMEVGAFGVGTIYLPTATISSPSLPAANIPENVFPQITVGGMGLKIVDAARYTIFNVRWNGAQILYYDGGYVANYELLHSANTTTDGSGFIKKASPIVRLFADHIELNHDAEKQPITFEKLDVGDYLIKGSLGFAQESWYIEVPKDANGNVLVAVVYEQLENNDISVKTYKKKFDVETASVVADLDKPADIPETRWIDLRLHEEPQPVPEMSEMSETPPDFQPTNLAKAVSEALGENHEPAF